MAGFHPQTQMTDSFIPGVTWLTHSRLNHVKFVRYWKPWKGHFPCTTFDVTSFNAKRWHLCTTLQQKNCSQAGMPKWKRFSQKYRQKSVKSCPLLPTVIQTITFFAPEKDFSKYSFNILKLRFQQFWFFLSKCWAVEYWKLLNLSFLKFFLLFVFLSSRLS